MSLQTLWQSFWSSKSASVVSLASLSPCTSVLYDNLRTVFALHRAAPVELAVAAAHYFSADLLDAQAALLAQPSAAVFFPLGQIRSTLQTLSAFRAMKSKAQVFRAVIRGILQIDELRARDTTERVRNSATAVVGAVPCAHAPFVQLKFVRLVVLYFQVIAHLAELGQLHPARLHRAALRHAMAAADPFHGHFYCLQHRFYY